MLTIEQKQQIIETVSVIPVVKNLDMRIEVLEPGFCRAVVPLDRKLVGIHGAYHGGLLVTAADSVACFAIMTETGVNQPMTTTDLHARYLDACTTDVTVEARVVKLGRTLCPVAVDLIDTSGTRVAVVQVTYFLLDRPPERA